MTQPVIKLSDRDYKLTPSGDLEMTTDSDQSQNAIGNSIVQLGNDIFDVKYGIDWGFIARLGNGESAKSYIKSVLREKLEAEGLDVINIKIASSVYPIYNIYIEYASPSGSIEILPLNFTV